MKNRIFEFSTKCLLLICLFTLTMFGCILPNRASAELMSAVLIPFDDRPVDLYFPQKVAESAGINVITPPKEIIGHFTQPGDGKALGKWLLENGNKADCFIISIDMLAEGGLVPSRTGKQSLQEANNNLEIVKQLKVKFPNKPIYAYNIIQRLTITVTNANEVQNYEDIRNWSILYDKVKNYGMKELEPEFLTLQNKIPKDLLDDFLNARQRNHTINQTMINWVKDGYIDYLILGQDDSYPYGIHRIEREKLAKSIGNLNVENKVSIFPGADQLDMLLIARMVNKKFNYTPKFYVQYSGIRGGDWIAPYEDIPFEQEIKSQIAAIGGEVVTSSNNSDIYLMIHTPAQPIETQIENGQKLIQQVKELVGSGKWVVVSDAASNEIEDTDFSKKLLQSVDVTKLLNYCSWNAANNVIGISISHASARYTFLNQTTNDYDLSVYQKAAKSNYDFLFERFIEDYSYSKIIRPQLTNYLQSIGDDPWNIKQGEKANIFVNDKLNEHINMLYSHFDGSVVKIAIKNQKQYFYQIKGMGPMKVSIPWNRTFEISVEPNLNFKPWGL